MKLIIAGSRGLESQRSSRKRWDRGSSSFVKEPPGDSLVELIEASLQQFRLRTVVKSVLCGKAKGVDKAGKRWAERARVPVDSYPADWSAHGKSAGPIRNGQMAVAADALLLIWDGKSSGSADMKRRMIKAGKPVYEVILRAPEQVLAAESGKESAAMELPFSGCRKGERRTDEPG